MRISLGIAEEEYLVERGGRRTSCTLSLRTQNHGSEGLDIHCRSRGRQTRINERFQGHSGATVPLPSDQAGDEVPHTEADDRSGQRTSSACPHTDQNKRGGVHPSTSRVAHEVGIVHQRENRKLIPQWKKEMVLHAQSC